MGFVRPAAVAGSFYPNDPGQLRQDVRNLLRHATSVPPESQTPKVLIVPHAGYIYSGPIAASAYMRLDSARSDITRVVMIGPAHRVAFDGIALSSAEKFATPLGLVPMDAVGRQSLLEIPGVMLLDQAHAQEHCLEVHLPFLQELLDHFTLLPILAGRISDDQVAMLLTKVWGGPETLIVISTDLSHYLPYDQAKAIDNATADAIDRLDFTALDHHHACGRTPLGGLMTLAKARAMSVQRLDLRNSGDTAGPRDHVVGYGAWALYDRALPEIAETLLEFARASIVHRLAGHNSPLAPPDLPICREVGACFVTLHKASHLRGCIGSASAWRSLGEDIADNAMKAAFNDPRFAPLSPAELPEIVLSLSLLSAPTPMRIQSRADLLTQLRPGRDGLIVEENGRRGLFLPAVWEMLPTAEAFVGHLLEKAGLPANYWSPSLKAWRFEAQEFHE